MTQAADRFTTLPDEQNAGVDCLSRRIMARDSCRILGKLNLPDSADDHRRGSASLTGWEVPGLG